MTIAGAACAALVIAGCSDQSSGSTTDTEGSSSGALKVTPAAIAESYVTGTVRPEDLVAVPGTPWVMVSSMASPKLNVEGHLYAVNAAGGEPTALWPNENDQESWDRTQYPECAGVPDAGAIEPHGITVRPGSDGSPTTLYAINHKRESVEVFTVNSTPDDVDLTWVGCVPLPANVYGNGVTPEADGSGFVVSSMYDPTEPGNPFERMFSGADTGRVMKWTAQQGWEALPGTELGGANGVLMTPDGQAVIAAAWTQKKVVRISTAAPHTRTEVELPFLPDNLRWTDEGTVLVTGQDITWDDIMTCNGGEGTNCPTGYTVVEIDPSTMTSEVVVDGSQSPISLATTALPVEDEIWVGSITGDRIARVRPQ